MKEKEWVKMAEKREYLLGVKSNSIIYPLVKYFGTLRGAKAACTRYYGPAIYKGEYLIIKEFDDNGADWLVSQRYADGWADSEYCIMKGE